MIDPKPISPNACRSGARAFPVLAILFITQQAALFGDGPAGHRQVDVIRAVTWLVVSGILLAALWTGGGWLRSRKVRALMNDEATRANRSAALATGFMAAMLGCLAMFMLSLFDPFSSVRTAQYISTIGIGAALLRFGTLERRALR